MARTIEEIIAERKAKSKTAFNDSKSRVTEEEKKRDLVNLGRDQQDLALRTEQMNSYAVDDVSDYQRRDALQTEMSRLEKQNTSQEKKLATRSIVDRVIEEDVRGTGFVDTSKANLGLGQLSQDESLAWNRYINNPSLENKRAAEAISSASEYYQMKQKEALFTEDAEGNQQQRGNWISKDLAQYLPQLADQIQAQVPAQLGAMAIGAATGGAGYAKAAQVLGGLAAGKQSFDVMRGASYKGLKELGVSEETAIAISRNEAFLSAMVESAETILSFNVLGFSDLLKSVGSFGVKKVAQGLAREGMEQAAESGLKKLLSVLKGYGINILSEAGEEAAQEAIAIQAEKTAMRNDGLERTATSEEDWQRIKESAAGGAKIAAMMGAPAVATTQIGNRVVQRRSAERIAQNERAIKTAVSADEAKSVGVQAKKEALVEASTGEIADVFRALGDEGSKAYRDAVISNPKDEEAIRNRMTVAYNTGLSSNKSFDEAKSLLGDGNENELRAFYEAAQKDRITIEESTVKTWSEAQSEIRSQRAEFLKTAEDGLLQDTYAEKLNPATRKSLDLFAKQVGNRIVIAPKVGSNAEGKAVIDADTVEGFAEQNGFYDPNTKTIFLNADLDNKTFKTAVHEVTHAIQKQNSKGYQEFKDIVVKAIIDTQGENAFQRYSDWAMSNYNVELSVEQAQDEMVANEIAKAFDDPKKFIEKYNGSVTIGRKIVEAIRKTLRKIKNTIATWNGTDAEKAEFIRYQEAMEQAQAKWMEALKGASVQGKAETDSDETSGSDESMFSLRKKDDYYNQINTKEEIIKLIGTKYYDRVNHPAFNLAKIAVIDLLDTQMTLSESLEIAKDTDKPFRKQGTVNFTGQGKLIGKRFIDELIDTGRVNLTGITFQDTRELALIAQIYRDPRFETFRVIFVKGNQIVGQSAVSSRLPSIAKAFINEDWDGAARDLTSLKDRLGADGYYLLHNHPSGIPEASKEDLIVTAGFFEKIPGFINHIIINSGKYTEIGIDTNPKRLWHAMKDLSVGSDKLLKGLYRKEFIREGISGKDFLKPQKLASAAKLTQLSKDQSVAFFISAKGELSAMMEIEDSFLLSALDEVKMANVSNFFKNRMKEYGAVYTVVVAQNKKETRLFKRSMEKLIKEGSLIDGITINENNYFSYVEHNGTSVISWQMPYSDNAYKERTSKPKPDIQFSLRAADKKRLDKEYLKAVKENDLVKAQKMVAEYAHKQGYIQDESYKMWHKAPTNDGFNKSIDDLTDLYPDDLYSSNGARYYGMGEPRDYEAVNKLRKVKGKPDAKIWVYRAVPKNVKESEIRNGDWITLTRDYAMEHGKSHINGSFRIISQLVNAKHVFTDANSIQEYGYDDGKNYAYQNTKNNRKLFDAVVHDDEGKVIPLSKRFDKKNYDARYSLRGSEVEITDETVGYSSGQYEMIMTAVVDGIKAGFIEYSVYQGKPYIKFINTVESMRRMGVATRLLQELQKEYPNTEIVWGYTTPDGTALKDKVTFTKKNGAYTRAKNEYLKNIERLNELGRMFDEEDYSSGDEWNKIYDRQAVLEKKLREMKPETSWVKYSLRDGTEVSTFYSKLAKTVQEAKQDTFAANGLVNFLLGRKVSKEEIEWMGIEQLVEGRKSIKKEELLGHLKDRDLKITEKVKTRETISPDEYEKTALENLQNQFDIAMENLKNEWMNVFNEVLPDSLNGMTLDRVYQNDYSEKIRKALIDKVRTIAATSDLDDNAPYQNLYYPIRGEFEGIGSEFQTIKRIANQHRKAGTYLTYDNTRYYRKYSIEGENYREILLTFPDNRYGTAPNHWDSDSPIFAHARVSEVTEMENGTVILFVDEAQSDWHERGRDVGYIGKGKANVESLELDDLPVEVLRNFVIHNDTENEFRVYEMDWNDENHKADIIYIISNWMEDDSTITVERIVAEEKIDESDTGAVPYAPFGETWHEVVLKRMIREVAEKGYDYMAWSPGWLQVERYNLEKVLSRITIASYGDGNYYTGAYDKNDSKVLSASGKFNTKRVKRIFGAELGKKMMKMADDKYAETNSWEVVTLEGSDLKTSGEGMRNFYDIGGKSSQNVPKFLNKYVKQWGSKVEEIEVDKVGLVPAIRITEAMKQSVLTEGQPLFSLRDSEGATLTSQQAEFFKDSKVRDEEGNLLRVYHGTDKDFTKFNKKYVGYNRGNQGFYGLGFYFTNKENIAKTYGDKVMATYLDIKNPYIIDETKSIRDYEELFNTKYERAERYRESGISEIAIMISFIRENNYSFELTKKLKRKGYDGVIYTGYDRNNSYAEYVAFSPEQIKSIDNLNPTANDDVRYSLRPYELENDIEALREEIEELEYELEFPFMTDVERKKTEKELLKLKNKIENLIQEERDATVKTPLTTILKNLKKYRRSDLESLAEQVSGGNWDDYEDLSRAELEEGIREIIEGQMEDLTPLEAQSARYGYYVRPVEKGVQLFQLRGSENLAAENRLLKKENALLKKRYDQYRKQIKLSRVKPDTAKIEAFAKRFLKEQSSDMELDAFVKTAKEIFDALYESNKGKGDSSIRGYAEALSQELAREVLGRIVETVRTDNEVAKEIRAFLRRVYIIPTHAAKEDVAMLKKKYRRLKFASQKQIESGGANVLGIDVVYGELVTRYPDLFDRDERDPEGMLQNLITATEATSIMTSGYMDINIDEYLPDVSMQILEAYDDVVELEAVLKERSLRIEQVTAEREKAKEALQKALEEADKEKIRYARQQVREREQELKAAIRDERKKALAEAKKQGEAEAEEVLKKKIAAVEEAAKLKIEKEKLKAEARIIRHKKKQQERVEVERQKRKNSNNLAIRKFIQATERTAVRKAIHQRINKLNTLAFNPTDKAHMPHDMEQAVVDITRIIRPFEKGGKPLEEDLKRLVEIAAYIRGLDNDDNGDTHLIDVDLADNLIDLAKIMKTKSFTDRTKEGSMSLDELQILNDTLAGIGSYIKMRNRLFTDAKSADVYVTSQQIADELSYETVTENGRLVKKPIEGYSRFESGLLQAPRDMVSTDMLAPLDFAERIGTTFQEVFQKGIRDGMDKKIKMLKHAEEYMLDLIGDEKVEEWSGPKAKLIERYGLRMTVAQWMSLYVTVRQNQAVEHIVYGGIVPTDYVVKGSSPVAVGKVQRGYEPVQLSEAQIRQIVEGDMLTEAQKRIALGVSDFFMSEVAEWGNEVSLLMYDYRKFTEENYFPIVSAKDYLSEEIGKILDRTLRNMGSTKKRIQGAKNPIYMEDIFDVFSNHVDKYSSYNAFVPALSDLQRIYNQQVSQGTVKLAIAKRYGDRMQQYYKKLIVDINGGMRTEPESQFANWLTSKYKSAVIGLNLRVIAQQPTSLVRASAMIDPKYLAKGMMGKVDWELVKTYAPIAQWKDWGYFTLDVGRQLRNVFLGKENITDKMMAGVGAADRFAWLRLWRAVEIETTDLRPELEAGSEEFFQHVGARFSEIIDRTQVVDTVLHRTGIMRGGTFSKMVTSFMSEPLKSYNLLNTAVRNFKSNRTTENASKVKRTFAAWAATVAVTGIARALMDMWRDEDEPEEGFFKEFFEKWFDNVKYEPLDMLPYVRDWLSIMQGYSVERLDTQLIEKAWRAFSRLDDGKYTLAARLYNMASVVFETAGIPASSATREISDLMRNTLNFFDGYEAQYSVMNMQYDVRNQANAARYIDLLFQAHREGDLNAYNNIMRSLIENGYTASKIDEGMRSRYKKAGNAPPEFQGKASLPSAEPDVPKVTVESLKPAEAVKYLDNYRSMTNELMDGIKKTDIYRTGNDVLRAKIENAVLDYAKSKSLSTASNGRYVEDSSWINNAKQATEEGVGLAQYIALLEGRKAYGATIGASGVTQEETADYLDAQRLEREEKAALWAIFYPKSFNPFK